MPKIMFKMLVLVAISPTFADARESYGNAYVGNIISVYDADTFRVDINGWPEIIGQNMPIRLKGVDAPEIRGKCESEKKRAVLARDFTKMALKNAKVIELRNIERGKYFRMLADVYIDNTSLSYLLLQSGMAREYNGGSRLTWCD